MRIYRRDPWQACILIENEMKRREEHLSFFTSIFIIRMSVYHIYAREVGGREYNALLCWNEKMLLPISSVSMCGSGRQNNRQAGTLVSILDDSVMFAYYEG